MKLGVAFAAALAGAATIGVAYAQDSGSKKIQCWTDKSGMRMCGDRVPPEYAGQKRDVIRDGRVVDTVKAAKTPEELAAEKRAQEQAEQARKQAAYDRALLETYRNAKDIEAMRDERVAMVDQRLKAAEKNAADTDKSLADLRARVDALAQKNEPVDAKLAKQIKQFERAQKENEKALTRYRSERDAITSKFNSDLARYNELKGIPPAPAPAAKPAGTPPAVPAAAPPAAQAQKAGS